VSVRVLARYKRRGDPYIRVRLSDGRIIGEHRFLIERKLGRKLQSNEHVHHMDENKRNNRLSNLELKSASSHVSGHHKPAKRIKLTCPACGQIFERFLRYVRLKQSAGVKNLFCSRSCRVRVPLYEKGVPDHVHGTANGYSYWRCRCQKCLSAKAKKEWDYRESRIE
jgi:hypothetical protein